jgi:hypothetical protein
MIIGAMKNYIQVLGMNIMELKLQHILLYVVNVDIKLLLEIGENNNG